MLIIYQTTWYQNPEDWSIILYDWDMGQLAAASTSGKKRALMCEYSVLELGALLWLMFL